MPGNTVTILLVEDDEVDAEAIDRAFKKARIANPIILAKDGIEAIEILRGSKSQLKLENPFLILLDLNMPRMNGIEFLEEIRSDESLNKSIVFVLTTSEDDRDILTAYDKHVAGYMVKSRAGEDFLELINMLEHYWRIIEFPPGL
ncbi:response regulator [Gimesia aquarii]|uniref:Response regulator rcp1 n=1 Tax=Gimesia aquarii TaxID=2527964 RepID=A0A517X040_9PLAN|nr:response regulator [Gimesia aquarii]QDU10870.1 Response regulator rcp1 [Gimesia aquarii]